MQLSRRWTFFYFYMIVNTELSRSTGHLQKDLWETPDHIFKPLERQFHFTLDPCCLPHNAKAAKFFTPEDDGLNQSWAGETVFCNPPYSRGNIDKWVEKCWTEAGDRAVVVALLPVSTSSKWFHDFVWHRAELRYYKGRIKFVGAPHTAPFSSMLAIWR